MEKVEVKSKKGTKLNALYQDIEHGLYENKKYLLGRVLTIVDASMSDPEQRKSVKDLVNTAFWGDTPVSNNSNWTIAYPIEQFAKSTGMKFDLFDTWPIAKTDTEFAPVNKYDELEN